MGTGETAYEDPSTRRAWRLYLLRSVVALLLWVLAFPSLVAAVVFTPVWTLIVFVPLLGIVAYQWLVSVAALICGARMRRILRVYPWQSYSGVVRAAKNGMPCFDLPDPDNSEKRVTIRMGGSLWSRWEREVRAGTIDEVWFSGDPRFAGVVAIPGPRRVAVLAQPQSYDSRTAPRKRGVSPQSRERARAAGVRVG